MKIWWERAFGWLLPVHLFTLLSLSVVEPNDFWWHLRYARATLAQHAFPDTDTMSFVTEGQRFVDQQWLSQMTLYGAYVAGGLALVVLVHAIVVTVGYAAPWAYVRSRVRPANAAVATVIAAAIGGAHWGVRPQSFSFLCFGVLVRLLDEHEGGRRRALWLAVPLFALWANLHGIYTLGWLAVGVHVGVRCIKNGLRAERDAVLAAGCCVLAGMINPHGPRGLVEHFMQFFERDKGIVGGAEFAAMSIRNLDGIMFAYGVGRLTYATIITGWRPSPSRAVLLVVFGVFALSVVRVEPWFGMLLLAPMAQALEREDEARERPVRPLTPRQAAIVAPAVVIVSLLAAVGALPPFRARLPLPPKRRVLASVTTPIEATRFLCVGARDGERVFADEGFASYISFACPGVKTFVDPRVTPFDAATWEQYGAVVDGRFDQQRILDRWRVEAVMLRADEVTGLAALAQHKEWVVVHRDDVAVLMTRM